jgi:glutathione S-transferase
MTETTRLPLLYGSRESGHAYKVKLALTLLGVAHEYREIDLRVAPSQRRPDFLRVSPYGEVPVFVDGEHVLAQSNAILLYLARETGRLGGGDLDLVTQWLFWEANRIGLSVPNLRHARVFAKDTSAAIGAWLSARAEQDLARLELQLANHAFVLGDECTVVDIACCAYLFWPEQAGLELSRWPTLVSWLGRIRGLPGWASPYDLLKPSNV